MSESRRPGEPRGSPPRARSAGTSPAARSPLNCGGRLILLLLSLLLLLLLLSGALPLLLVALFRKDADGDGFALLDSIAAMAAAVDALSLLTLLSFLSFPLLGPKRRTAALSGGLERHDDFVSEFELGEVLPLPLLFSLLLLLLLLPGLRLSTLSPFADLSLRSAADQIDVLPLPAHGLAAFSFALPPGLLLSLLLALLILLCLSALAALAFADRPPDDQKVIGLGDDRLPGVGVDQGFADDRHAGEGSADPLLLSALLLLLPLLLLLLLSAGLIAALLSAVLFLGGNTRHEQQRHEQSG